MKKYLNIIILSICLMCFTQCKKDVAPTPITYTNYTPNQTIKDYCIFKTGTYWVYKDSTSGKLDSVWVYHYNQTTDTFKKTQTDIYYCPVYLYRTFSSKYRSNNYVEFNTAFEVNENLNLIYESVIDSTGFIGMYVKAFSPFTINRQQGEGIDVCTLEQNIDSLFGIGGNKFKSVLKYTHTQDYSNYYFINYQHFENKTNTYFAPHIGMVRKEVPDSNIVWNLIRYHIVQ